MKTPVVVVAHTHNHICSVNNPWNPNTYCWHTQLTKLQIFGMILIGTDSCIHMWRPHIIESVGFEAEFSKPR